MLTFIIDAYNTLFIAALFFILLDWMFALDKINPVLDRTIMSGDDYLVPVIGSEFIALFTLFVAVITKIEFFVIVSSGLTIMSMGLLVLGLFFYSIFVVLSKVRKYFITRKV
ncbi:hypothetical protein [Yersinia phage fHe-Yen9-04]|uniref:Uncharacterized protein n=2 Tax=Eneladusvirus Yen904 TaxID=2560849 RepID=A0A2C9CY78_9CAUD|nr:membrane protein [Yersinia phage fHe-Yen9-04]SOK58801.1 hypothetical protein [Yersinia phage fHe-Yen9-04]SOK59339.1 hypothetical protein [Yersinia phage fHe-Yen9-03]VUE36570.1 hypothetical protein [Yersinia phage fHe-Yen9-04]